MQYGQTIRISGVTRMLKDRIKVITNTAGTGILALGSADSGFQDFSSISGQTYYALTNKSSWEVGLGTVSSGTLSRDEVYDSSSSGNRIDLSGKSTVFVTYPASKAVYLSPSANPASGEILVHNTHSWDSRPLSNDDITTALGYVPPSSLVNYSANSGIVLSNNNFSLGGTGILESLIFSKNISIGESVGISRNPGGEDNILIGNGVGYASLDPGTGNIYIGKYAGYGIRGRSNNIEIRTSGSFSPVISRAYSDKLLLNNLIVGDFVTKTFAIGKVCSDEGLSLYNFPNATLEVLPNLSTHKALVVKGAVSHSANLFEVDNSAGNNLFQIDANGIPSGSRIILASSGNNILIGNATGGLSLTNSIAIGNLASRNSSDNLCVSIGSYAGFSSISGSKNVSIGDNSGRSQTSSTDNVSLGIYAGGNGARNTRNVSIGYYSSFSSYDTNKCVSIGDSAGAYISGTGNISIGNAAGVFADGNNNIYIGKEAGNNSQGSNNIEIVVNNDTYPIQNLSDKIHIQKTIIGDLVSKKLAIGNIDASNVSPNATLEILPRVSGDVGLMVKGVASHSANLFEVNNVSGNNLFTVAPNGLTSGVRFVASGGLVLNSGIPSNTTSCLYASGTNLLWQDKRVLQNKIVEVSGNYYMTGDEDTFIVHSGMIVLLLSKNNPNYRGMKYNFKATSDGVTLEPMAIVDVMNPSNSFSDSIDGSYVGYTMKKNDCVTLMPGASGWYIISKYTPIIDGNL